MLTLLLSLEVVISYFFKILDSLYKTSVVLIFAFSKPDYIIQVEKLGNQKMSQVEKVVVNRKTGKSSPQGKGCHLPHLISQSLTQHVIRFQN